MNQMLWFMAVIPVLGKLWHKLKASLGYSEFRGSLSVSVPLYPQLLVLPHTHTRVLLRDQGKRSREKDTEDHYERGWGNRKEVGQHLPH